MKYKLKDVDGWVEMMYCAGGDWVKHRISVETARSVIEGGKLVESNLPQYPICVDFKYYFPGERIEVVGKNKRKKTGGVNGLFVLF